MDEEKRKAYSEVVEILKLIEDEKKLEKIPFEVIELIKRNSDPTYKPSISKEIPLEEQSFRNETYSILGWIANKYWNENVEAVQNLDKEIREEQETNINNENNTQNSENIHNIEKTGNYDKLEESSENIKNIEQSGAPYNDIDPTSLEANNLPVVVTEIKWYQKLKNQVIKLFKLIFGIKNKDEENSLK